MMKKKIWIKMPDYICISKSTECDDQIFTLLKVRTEIVNSQSELDKLAYELNSDLKCEGAKIIPLNDTVKYHLAIPYTTCIFIQTWG